MTTAERLAIIDANTDKVDELNQQLELTLYGTDTGGKSYCDLFWDLYQANGNRRNYENAFRADYSTGAGIQPEIFYPKYDIIATGSANFMFANFGNKFEKLDLVERLKECDVVLDISGAGTLNQAFVNAWFTRLPALDISKSTNNNSCFSCAYLVTIEKLIVSEGQTYPNTFHSCHELVNILFEGVIGTNISFPNSNKLSDTSVQSIIDHLKDLTGQTAQTLTFHKDVGNKLTDAQKATISAKNWTLAY
jgi:hypothetical protein